MGGPFPPGAPEAICIVETDMEVDFEAPADYVEPVRSPPSSSPQMSPHQKSPIRALAPTAVPSRLSRMSQSSPPVPGPSRCASLAAPPLSPPLDCQRVASFEPPSPLGRRLSTDASAVFACAQSTRCRRLSWTPTPRMKRTRSHPSRARDSGGRSFPWHAPSPRAASPCPSPALPVCSRLVLSSPLATVVHR